MQDAVQLLAKYRDAPDDLWFTEILKAHPLSKWQREASENFRKKRFLAIRSGHGVGKSTWISGMILKFFFTRYPAVVPCLSPTSDNLKDVLFKEITSHLANMPSILSDLVSPHLDTIRLKGDPKCLIRAKTAKKGDGSGFQGFHGQNVLLVADEAAGVDESLMKSAIGVLSTPNAKAIFAGNPTVNSGFFYNLFHSDNIEGDDEWALMTVSSEDYDYARGHIKATKLLFPGDQNEYMIRVLGQHPDQERDAFISKRSIVEAIQRGEDRERAAEAAELAKQYYPVWGIDVARKDTSRSVLVRRRGNILMEPPVIWPGAEPVDLADKIADVYFKTDEEELPKFVNVDGALFGYAVADMLRRRGIPAVAVMTNSAASDPLYSLKRDEIWHRTREWLKNSNTALLKGEEEGTSYKTLMNELVAIRAEIVSDKLRVEDKRSFIKRLQYSPDLADALTLTFAQTHDELCYQRGARKKKSDYERRPPRSWMTA